METSWTVTKEERREVVRGLWRGFLLSGSAGIMLIVMVLVCLFVASWKGGNGVVNLVIAVIVIAFAGWMLRRGLARRVEAAYPIGFTASSTVTDDGFRVTSAIGSTDIPWANMRRARVLAGAVMFSVPTSRLQRVGYPRYLVPDAALARMGH